MLTLKRLLAGAAGALLGLVPLAALAQDKPSEVTVAYFLEWPTPNLKAQVEGTFDKEMGVKVNWRAFDTGAAMTQALASGDVQFAYSQGIVPFTVAVSSGVPLKAVAIATSYSEDDNCVVRREAGVTKENASDLIGKKIAVPLGTVPHYRLLKQLDNLGVDTSKLTLVDMAPADGAAAIARGDVDMACGWSGPLKRMKEHGEVLLTSPELEEMGLKVFDVVSTPEDFAKANPELVVKFLQVIEDANRQARQNPEAFVAPLAKASGMSEEDVRDSLTRFQFPLKEEQLSEAWLGKTVPEYMKQIADFYVAQKNLDKALDDYTGTIDTSYLQQVK